MSYKNFTKLINWSSLQYSELPWRKERTMYRTLVSEIMLQQTTVGTVLNHFEKFLILYPTLESLAMASEEEVCIAWKGLGYYRRARLLRNLANDFVHKFNGEIPNDLNLLLSLKGIGPYTANALVAIGANERGLAVDANLERVLSRYYGIHLEKGPKLQKKIWEMFDEKTVVSEIEKVGARALNEAFMDLGRVVCQSKSVKCLECPLRSSCFAYASLNPLLLPLNSTVEKKQFNLKLLRIIVIENESILFYQKNNKEWLNGQWEVPTFILESEDATLSQYPRLEIDFELSTLVMFKTSITKYKIENYAVLMTAKEFSFVQNVFERDWHFKSLEQSLNLSTASIKTLSALNLYH